MRYRNMHLLHLASSEGSDETVHTHSLVKAFTARTQEVGASLKALDKFHTCSPTR